MIDDAPAPAPAARLPLRAWLALAVVLASVAGVGYLMFDRLFAGAGDSRDLVEINPTRGFGGAFGRPRAQPDAVREVGRNSYQVRAGEARLSIRQARQGEWTYAFSYQKRDLLTPEQDAALMARWRLTRDAAYAKSLDVTPEQIKQLEDVPGRDGMLVTDADEVRIKRLFEAYLKAAPPRTKESAALVQALRQIGDQSLAPTRAALAERAAKVQAILTREQIEKFRRPGN